MGRKELGELLSKRRRELGLLQAGVAQQVNELLDRKALHQATISRIERGKEDLNEEKMEALSVVLDISIDALRSALRVSEHAGVERISAGRVSALFRQLSVQVSPMTKVIIETSGVSGSLETPPFLTFMYIMLMRRRIYLEWHPGDIPEGEIPLPQASRFTALLCQLHICADDAEEEGVLALAERVLAGEVSAELTQDAARQVQERIRIYASRVAMDPDNRNNELLTLLAQQLAGAVPMTHLLVTNPACTISVIGESGVLRDFISFDQLFRRLDWLRDGDKRQRHPPFTVDELHRALK